MLEVISLSIIVYNIFLLIISLFKSRVSYLREYFLYVFSLTVWVISLYLYTVTLKQSPFLLFIGRFNFFCALLLIYSYYKFIFYFPFRLNLKFFYDLAIDLLFVIISIITLFSPLVDKSENIVKHQHVVQFGSLSMIYIIYILLIVGLIFYSIIKKVRESEADDKVRLYYFTTGTILTFIFGFLTQLILPYVFNNFQFLNIGILSLLFITYYMHLVVVNTDFHNFKITLIDITYYIILFFLSILYFYFIVNSGKYLFGSLVTSDAQNYVLFILFVTIVALSRYLVKFKKLVGKIFKFSLEEFNSKNQEIIKSINAIYNVDDTLVSVLKEINELYGSEKNSLIIFKGETVRSYGDKFNIILDKHTIDSLFENNKSIYRFDNKISEQAKNIVKDEISFLFKLDLKVADFAVFIVGNKKNKDFFDIEEQDSLYKVIEFLNIALERALLFQENNELLLNLEDKIKEATNELKIKNDELQEAYNDANETAREERDMLDIMGHELRTPATVVRMAAYLLETKISDDYGKKQIYRIKDSIERQIKLINTFINTAKIDNNKIELVLEPIHMDEMLRRAVEDHMNEAIEKGLTITYDENGQMPYVLADNARIREVVDNFITNAIKYTFQGYVKVRNYVENEEVVIAIEDSGEGIKEEDKQELFQKFKRVNNYTSTSDKATIKMIRPGGTGLGLYVSKGIVEMHKGRIWVESVFGKGSTFSFALPLAKQEEIDKYKNENYVSANMFNKVNLK